MLKPQYSQQVIPLIRAHAPRNKSGELMVANPHQRHLAIGLAGAFEVEIRDCLNQDGQRLIQPPAVVKLLELGNAPGQTRGPPRLGPRPQKLGRRGSLVPAPLR